METAMNSMIVRLVICSALVFTALPAQAQVQAQDQAAPPALPTPAAGAGASDLPAPLPLTCLLTPSRISDIGSDRSGIVASVAVSRADLVAAGDPLVQIDTTLAEADLRVARISVAALQERLTRTEGLLERNLISRDEIGALRAELELARADEARAALEIARATIRAPFSGYVTDVAVAPGELIGPEPLLRLIEVDRLRAELVYRAETFGLIAPGDIIGLRIDLGQTEVDGVVTAIDPFIDAASNTFTVIAEIENADLGLPVGSSCSVIR
jgi:membrane fusion protein (multidrug efflux system)